MARSRNVKPGFFTNELLAEIPCAARLLFIGLWCLADRDGRLEDRPVQIKMRLFSADSMSAVDIDAFLDALHKRGFIYRYGNEAGRFIQVVEWKKHQNPHFKEKMSIIPSPESLGLDPRSMAQKPQAFKHYIEQKASGFSEVEDFRIATSGQEVTKKASGFTTVERGGSPADSLIPDSPIPDSLPPISPSVETGAAEKADSPPPTQVGKRVVKPAKPRIEPDAFAEFYALYPRKVGRPKAAQSFSKLTEAEQRNAIAAIPKFAASWKWRMEPDFIPHPTTWLNQRRWEDEPPPEHPSAPAARQPHAPKQSRQNAVFEVLANDHRHAETAARLAEGQPPQGLLAAHPAESGLHARAGHGSNDADCLDADFSEQGHR